MRRLPTYERAPDDPHTFRWWLGDPGPRWGWGTVWTRRATKLANGAKVKRSVRLHLRRTSWFANERHDYSVAHDLSRRQAWRLGWALVVRAVTR
jgi:hypothetical protein